MGKLMDRVMGQIDVHQKGAENRVRSELQRIVPRCAWTSGVWKDLDGMRWNELQNLPNHIRKLTNILIRAHAGRGREAA
jgi:hypothetical protein